MPTTSNSLSNFFFELGEELRKIFFRLVTSVGQRKNSESPWGIEPQTFWFALRCSTTEGCYRNFFWTCEKREFSWRLTRTYAKIFLNKILFKNVASYKVLGLLHYGSRNGAKFNRSNCCQHQHLLLTSTIKFVQLQRLISITTLQAH